jgi:hypothetical protein
MRDVVWMGPLRQHIEATIVDAMLETAIYDGVKAEIDKRKRQRQGMVGSVASSQGQGRGRGQVTSRN